MCNNLLTKCWLQQLISEYCCREDRAPMADVSLDGSWRMTSCGLRREHGRNMRKAKSYSATTIYYNNDMVGAVSWSEAEECFTSSSDLPFNNITNNAIFSVMMTFLLVRHQRADGNIIRPLSPLSSGLLLLLPAAAGAAAPPPAAFVTIVVLCFFSSHGAAVSTLHCTVLKCTGTQKQLLSFATVFSVSQHGGHDASGHVGAPSSER